MGKHYDSLETRSNDERAHDLTRDLPAQITNAKTNAPGFCETLKDINPNVITQISDLEALPVLRKSSLSAAQKANAPLGGIFCDCTKRYSTCFSISGAHLRDGPKRP